MSYCVNCGVELKDSEKRCPLCDTIVLNPKTFGSTEEALLKSMKPQKQMENVKELHVDFKLFAKIISLLMIIPIGVTLMCDFLQSHTFTWSLYVLGAVLLAYIVAIIPAFFKLKKPYPFILLDGVTVFLYLCLINILNNGKWIISIALPLSIMTTIFALLYALIIRTQKVYKLVKTSAIILFSGLYSLALEIVLNEALKKGFGLRWSQYVLMPCAILCIVLLFINSQKKLKEELNKKLFM